MSIGSFVLTGIGGGSTVALFINEGFGVTAAAPAPSVVLGGMAKRKRGRYEFEINGQRFVARSVAALEAMVLAWRKAQPANDAQPIGGQMAAKRKEVVADKPGRVAPSPNTVRADHIATPPATSLAPGAVRAPQLVPISSDITIATQAFAAARAETQAAAAQAEADEEADIEALLMMLLEAA